MESKPGEKDNYFATLRYILEAIYKIHFKGITKDGMAYSAIEFERDIRLWDSLFEDYHRSSKDGLKRTMNVVKELVDLIKKKFQSQV